jgi:hypothetical protein
VTAGIEENLWLNIVDANVSEASGFYLTRSRIAAKHLLIAKPI